MEMCCWRSRREPSVSYRKVYPAQKKHSNGAGQGNRILLGENLGVRQVTTIACPVLKSIPTPLSIIPQMLKKLAGSVAISRLSWGVPRSTQQLKGEGAEGIWHNLAQFGTFSGGYPQRQSNLIWFASIAEDSRWVQRRPGRTPFFLSAEDAEWRGELRKTFFR